MNIVAILVSAGVAFIVGFLLHGPLGGKTWMRLANIRPTGNEKFSDMVPQMIWNYIANVITAFVMSGVLWMAFSTEAMGELVWYKGPIVAFWMWLGFHITATSMDVIWMKRSWKLWAYDGFSALLSLMAMGAVLTAW
ncbi:MAG: hypothetical protein QG653_57 [Patescibacteria group bacterium]|nr:hypothetical protein [Patescibacteria group bacterium]